MTDPLDPDEAEYPGVAEEVPAEQRGDGWTAARRVGFLEALWNGAGVTEAARHVGMTPQSARKLRLRAPAFRASWDDATAFTIDQLADTAFDRAINGSERPIWRRGRIVGSRIVHHDSLLMRLLSIRDPENYAPIDVRERWRKLRESAEGEGSAESRAKGSWR
jgi:hypothetical protein